MSVKENCNKCFDFADPPKKWAFKLPDFKRPVVVTLCPRCYEKVLPTARISEG
jgi:hypothetical protein